MAGKLHEIMFRVYGAFPLPLTGGKVRPGTLLETFWEPAIPWDTRPVFRREEGYAWEVLEVPADGYEDEEGPGNILAGDILEKMEFGAHLPLPQYGLEAGLDFANRRTATLTVTAVKVRTFRRGFSGHELRARLRDLRKGAPQRWKWVLDDFLVTDSYHTDALRFEFRQDGEASAKTELDKAGIEAEGKVQLSWEDEWTLVLRGTAKAPFAVRGFKIW